MTSIYDNIYQLITTYIYGGTTTWYQEFIATQLSTIFVVFTLIIPFIVVLSVIKAIINIWK